MVVEYAKAAHDDILMLVTAHNRGPEPATLHLLPTLWFRNTWSGAASRPSLSCAADGPASRAVASRARGVAAARRRGDALLFCENETNNERLFGGRTRAVPQGRDQRLRRPRRAGRGEPGPHGHEGRRAPRARDPAGRQRVDPRAPDAPSARATPAELRRRDGRPPRGGRRVLRDGHPVRRSAPTRALGDAPGAGRAAVGQAVLRVRRPPLAARARRQPVGRHRGAAMPCATCRGSTWSPATSSRCPTSGSTPGSPRGTWRSTARRCRSSTSTSPRQQVELLLAHALPAPQRPDPGLRVELQRRQPARDRVGGAVRLRARGRDPRRGRPRVPRARVRAAADELHLVGQPQGPRRPQPLPGRLPRPRQHRDLRPLGAAAGRRHARAGGRHGVDGPLLPVDAADRGRAARGTTPPTPTWR